MPVIDKCKTCIHEHEEWGNNVHCQKCKPYCVQMVSDNYDILHNDRVKEKYPQLYTEVHQHDTELVSSWYDLSRKAYGEYLNYMRGGSL
jgi:hypothetical protein